MTAASSPEDSGTREVVIRPNGKPYRPRKGLRQIGYSDRDDYGHVVVMGTHDVDKARAFATPYQTLFLVEPIKCWAKSVMRDGEPYISTDAWEHGAAAIDFRESDDPEGLT